MKKNSLKLSLSLLLLLSACASPDAAQLLQPVDNLENQPVTTERFISTSVHDIFNEYDLNKNNTIELSELAEAPNSFKQMDINKDGHLTLDEVQPAPDRVQKMSGMINQFYGDLYNSMNGSSNGSLSTSALAASSELEPFRDSEEWNNSVSAMSAQSGGSMNKQQFISLMNGYFLGMSQEQEGYHANGLWGWLKEKFSKNKTPANTVGTAKPPVILVQGYAEPSWYFLYGIYKNLKKTGRDVYPVNLFPNIGDIREQAKIVAKKIELAKKEKGVTKVDYVCHSMGGLIGRYYIQNMDGVGSIDHYVSISTPHYGTYAAWLGIGEAAKQMRPGSEFLKDLNKENPIRGTIKYTSIWTKTDEIVVPSSNSVLHGSTEMPPISFVGHLLILFAPKTYTEIRESLDK
jgi:triacylglycerol lipase